MTTILKPFLIFTFFCLSYSLQAEEIIVAGDGKKYQLNDDGSWEIVSEDRTLDTDDGRRVILKTDGSWHYLGMAPEVNETKFQSLMISVTIDSIQIDELRESVGGGKNTRISSNTTLELSVNLADTAASALDMSNLNKNNFLLTDNRGKKYPVISVEAATENLKPGSSTSVKVTSKKAPKRLRMTSEMLLEIAPQTLGNDKAISLSYDFRRVKRNTEVK